MSADAQTPRIQIMLRTAHYRGDHAADVWRVVEFSPGETIERMCERAGLGKNEYAQGECIEIRLVEIPA